ncbi:P-loop containing nucleoside triphosphate hydrolase protein [Suillus bovinus]|uniref:P-loop containing nucleoside triphosphate hydrolase protein n=1 Tax=Suillus bovinus TaxID=48563 RepID=UPI001B86BB17|nr:P-loop containing nucleoside triphosphate hydrolase protein [Suillus bovinus]KAG2140960.1 P-loop containing nucleoside triphosphate hydrolase protein [Suillus bovinus]
MSLAPSSTGSFHALDQNLADHDSVIAGATSATKSSSVNLTTEMQTVPMSPNTVPSFLETGVLSAEPVHTLDLHPAGHDSIHDGVMTATKSYSASLTTEKLMVLMSTDETSSNPEAGKTLSAESAHTLDQTSASDDFHVVDGVTAGVTGATKSSSETHTASTYWFNLFQALMSNDAMTMAHFYELRSRRPSSTSRTSDQSAVHFKRIGLKKASRRKDTCNIVIFGQTGAGKSSLVNLITRTQAVPTSLDAEGCTTQTTVYEHDIMIQNRTSKLQLFDTAGLDEGPQGTVPNRHAENALKKLFQTLEKIHILMYCVQGAKDLSELQRNYESFSKFKENVPIVLVVTGLENRGSDMEDWWRSNERSVSDLGMNFSGHACITALTINQDDTNEVRQLREQSYDTICNLIGQFCPHNETGVHEVPTIARKTKNIVLFGEAGAGKSSVVNLMAGKEVAKTSLSMQRCTLHWQDYVIDFDGESYKVFDTLGIEESGLEMKEYLAAVANAYRFIKALDAEGGVDLLLFCIRAGRFTAALQSNYRFFHEFLCDKKVPIVLAITNLEREERMEDWWEREHSIFTEYQIHVADHACITAVKLEGVRQQLYAESRDAIRRLVKENVAGEHNRVWTGGNNAFMLMVHALKKILVKSPRIRKRTLAGRLVKYCGISRETAGRLADMIEQESSK